MIGFTLEVLVFMILAPALICWTIYIIFLLLRLSKHYRCVEAGEAEASEAAKKRATVFECRSKDKRFVYQLSVIYEESNESQVDQA